MRILSITDDDVFISYARIDTTTYAIGLANALTEKGFSCFTDRLGTDANENLPPMLLEKVRKSRMFILLCSSAAIKSEFVRQELTEFITSKGTAKMVVPVIFDAEVKKQEWYKQVIGIASEFESIDLLKTGNPSETVINRIEKSFHYSKSKERLRNYTIGASISLVALLTASVVAAIYASNQLETAENATLEAEKQRGIAIKQTNLAKAAEIKAAKQTDIATKAKSRADTAIALQKTAEADAKLAAEQLKGINIQLNERQYELDVTNTFNTFRQGADIVNALKGLQLDPLIGLHERMATNLTTLKAQPIIEIQPAISFIKLSEKENQLLVVYGQQAYETVDVDDFPDNTAFEVIDLKSRRSILSQPIRDTIGGYVFGLHASSVLAFEESGHIIVGNYNDSIVALERYSLKDGSTTALSASETSNYIQGPETKNSMSSRGKELMDAELSIKKLYATHPDSVITEDSNRVVEMLAEISPDGRTQFVGTYEGRMMLFDLAAGFKRGELNTSSVFSAEYTSDSNYVFVADNSTIWKIDANGWPELEEVSTSLPQYQNASDNERILELAISDDGQLVALASQYRLMVYNKQSKRLTDWELPAKLDGVAGMNIDSNNQKVNLITNQGSIFTADYISEEKTFRENMFQNNENQIVAWIEPDLPIAWMACKSMNSSHVEVYKIPIYDKSATIEKLAIPLPQLYLEPGYSYNTPEIRCLAKIDNQLAFVFGDPDWFEDNHPLINEHLMVAEISSPHSVKLTTLYKFDYTTDRYGEYWKIPPTNKIASVSNAKRIMAQKKGEGMISVGLDGTIKSIASNLTSRDIVFDKDGGYNIALESAENSNIRINISHLRRDVSFSYILPWKFNNQPSLAAISPNGRNVVVVSKEGDILIVAISDDSN